MGIVTTQFLFFFEKNVEIFFLIKKSLLNMTSLYRKHHTLGYI